MNTQQLKDYYYGYNLRLADELGQFNEYIIQSPTLEGLIDINKNLKYKLLERARRYTFEGRTEEQVITEVFNEPMTDTEEIIERGIL